MNHEAWDKVLLHVDTKNLHVNKIIIRTDTVHNVWGY